MRKLVNLLVRRAELSHDEFREYWLDEHAPLAEELPGVRKYTTSIPDDPSKSPYDGIAELYLEEGASVSDIFSSEAGSRLQADAETFLDQTAGEILVVDETIQFAEPVDGDAT